MSKTCTILLAAVEIIGDRTCIDTDLELLLQNGHQLNTTPTCLERAIRLHFKAIILGFLVLKREILKLKASIDSLVNL